jgi:hypothetical protein
MASKLYVLARELQPSFPKAGTIACVTFFVDAGGLAPTRRASAMNACRMRFMYGSLLD